MLQRLSIPELSHKIIRKSDSDLRYVKVEIECFPRQGLRGAIPDTADVLIAKVTLWRRGLHQTGRSRHHQLQDVVRFPPMDSLQSEQTSTHEFSRATRTKSNTRHTFRNKQPHTSFLCGLNAVLFLEVRVLALGSQWEAVGKWMQYENKQRTRLQQTGRLFMVRVCLQIYCTDTKCCFFFRECL